MTTNFPAGLDNFTNPSGSDLLTAIDHAGQHSNKNDAIEAMQRVIVGPSVYNVKAYGAVGDGVANDRAAINSCIAAAPDGSTIVFPAGIYSIGTGLLSAASRSNLKFDGGRGATLLRNNTAGILAFTSATNIEVTGFTFDNNGSTDFDPQLEFTGPTNQVWIHHNKFINTGSPAPTGIDRYACVFNAVGTSPVHHDVWFTDNYIKNLQAEFDSIERFYVLRNTSVDNVDSAAFGCFLINGDNQVIRDGLIAYNVIIDGDEVAIPLVNDPGTGDFCTMERVTVRNNLFVRTANTSQRSIYVGTVNAAAVAASNVWRDIHVDDNIIVYLDGTGATTEHIYFNSSTTATITFDHCSVNRNRVLSLGAGGGRGIRLVRMQDSEVIGNVVMGTGEGLWMQSTSGSALMANNLVKDNVLRNIVTTGITYQNSSGGNVLTGNRFMGTLPTTQYSTSTVHATDIIEKPALTATATWDPASIADGDDLSTTITVTGAAVGDVVLATLSTIGANDVFVNAHVESANTVRVKLLNRSGGALNIASGTLRVVVLPYA